MLIYEVPKGEMVILSEREGTFTAAVDLKDNSKVKSTAPVPMGGWWLPVAAAIVAPSLAEERAYAQESLDLLPDLAFQFILTWTPDSPFSNCLIVATSKTWWQKYRRIY